MTILILDIGSSSLRAMLFDEQARPIPNLSASFPHEVITEPAGAGVLDVRALQASTERAIDAILSRYSGPIRAVGMATLAGNLVGVDGQNQPLTPLYLYSDTRSAPYLDALTPDAESYSRTGCRHHTAYHPSRLHWLRESQPALFQFVAAWLDLGSYLYRQWFDSAVPISYSVAAWSGLLNRRELGWDVSWLERLDLDPDTLPALADYDNVQVGLSAAYRERWPQLHNTPFYLAVGDGAAANVGCGAVTEDKIALTVGTTAALRRVTTSATLPDGLWSYRVDRHHYLVGGATSEGGNIFHWAREVLRITEQDETSLLDSPAAGHGLTFLPLLAGERSPGWSPSATGSIVGLRLSTTPRDILQAALEGVALRLSIIADQLGADATVIASGGALQGSSGWGQIITDALNRPMHLAQGEITARGAALLVLRHLDGLRPEDYPPEIVQVWQPRPEHAEALRDARATQTALYKTLL